MVNTPIIDCCAFHCWWDRLQTLNGTTSCSLQGTKKLTDLSYNLRCICCESQQKKCDITLKQHFVLTNLWAFLTGLLLMETWPAGLLLEFWKYMPINNSHEWNQRELTMLLDVGISLQHLWRHLEFCSRWDLWKIVILKILYLLLAYLLVR